MNEDKTCIQIADLHYYQYETMNRVYSPDGLCPTIRTVSGGNGQAKVLQDRVRQITEREYFRLMGFSDTDVDILVQNGFSKTQMYKMAGNSIVVTVLEHLFQQLYKDTSRVDLLKEQSLAILEQL